MMHRLSRVICIALLVSGVLPVHCFGWQSTPAGRMDCCREAGHECADQRAADNCCQSGDQRDEQTVPGVVLLPVAREARGVTIDFAPTDAILAVSPVRWFLLGIDGRPSRPAYALTSVLLI